MSVNLREEFKKASNLIAHGAMMSGTLRVAGLLTLVRPIFNNVAFDGPQIFTMAAATGMVIGASFINSHYQKKGNAIMEAAIKSTEAEQNQASPTEPKI